MGKIPGRFNENGREGCVSCMWFWRRYLKHWKPKILSIRTIRGNRCCASNIFEEWKQLALGHLWELQGRYENSFIYIWVFMRISMNKIYWNVGKNGENQLKKLFQIYVVKLINNQIYLCQLLFVLCQMFVRFVILKVRFNRLIK